MKWTLAAGLVACGAGAAGWAYARYVEPGRFETRALELTLPGLHPAFDGFRIAHLSDLHLDVMNPRRLAEIAARTRAAHPNLVAFTGDFLTAAPGFDAAELVRFLRALAAPEGIFAVLGNHDHVGHVHALRLALAEADVTELANTAHTLRRGDAALHLAGVDSVYHRLARLDLALAAVPDDGAPAILLAHEPDIADVAAPLDRFALQLSGHAHGGQIALPAGLTALGLPEHGRRYVDGLYLVERMFVYANRGLGMTSAPLRFNSRPEIAVITLRTVG
jgi:predicted MPP superfamily phosphohydrolase